MQKPNHLLVKTFQKIQTPLWKPHHKKKVHLLVHSQQPDSRLNETTETYFNSTLLDEGTLF